MPRCPFRSSKHISWQAVTEPYELKHRKWSGPLNAELQSWPCMFLCSLECLSSGVSSPDLRPALAWITRFPLCVYVCVAVVASPAWLPDLACRSLSLNAKLNPCFCVCALLAWRCRLLQAAKGLAPWWHDVRRPAGERGDVHWHVSVCTCVHALTHNPRKRACSSETVVHVLDTHKLIQILKEWFTPTFILQSFYIYCVF